MPPIENQTALHAFETIRLEVGDSLAWITLNRPEKLNAINPAMVMELNTALDIAEADDQVRVIILKGEGRAFSAGFDLDEETTATDAESRREILRQELHKDFNIIMRFWDSPKPTISAVHTYCIGGAMEFAVACDITLAAEGCRFGAPEVRFGSGIVSMLYPWLCGPKRAKELLLTGNSHLSAEQALDWGLINRIVTADELLESAAILGQDIAGNDTLAVKLTKLAINRSCDESGFRAALDQALELDVEIECAETEESKQFYEILKTQGMKAATAWRDRTKNE